MQGASGQYIKNRSHTMKQSIQLAFLILFLAACEADKTDVEYLASAKQYLARGDLKAHEIELKNALQQNPENGEARFLLGLQYLTSQLGAPAEKELNRAIEFGESPAKIAEYLIKAKYYQFKYDEILSMPFDANEISSEALASVYLYRGLSNINLNQPKESESEFENAANADKESADSKLARAYLFALYKNHDDSYQLIQDILAKSPNHTESYILKSRVSQALEKQSEAIEAINKAIELEPNRLNLFISAARLNMANQHLEEAEKRIETVLKTVPKHLYSNLIKARLRLQARDWAKAREHAEVALSQSEVNKEAKLISGTANFYMQEWEEARDRLNSVRKFINPEHMAHRMLSYAEFQLGYNQSADAVIDSIGTLKSEDEQLLITYGNEFVKSGKIEDAVSLFETAAGLNPDNTDILTKIGILELERDQARGLDILEKVLEQDATSFWARAAIVRSYLAQGEKKKASSIANELIKLEPQTPEGYILLSDVQLASQQTDQARATLESGLTKAESKKSLYAKLFTIAAATKDFDNASRLNSKILEIDPLDTTALFNFYRLHKRDGNVQPAIAKIEQTAKENPDDDRFKLLSSLFYIDSGSKEKGLEILNNIPAKSSHYANAQAALGNFYAGENDFNAAADHFRKWLNADERSEKALRSLLTMQKKSGKDQDALQTTRRALKVFPDSKTFQIEEIHLLLKTGREQQALAKADRLKLEQVSFPELDMLIGRYFASETKLNKALEHFRQAHSASPGTLSLIAMAEVQNKQNDIKSAKKTLSNWLKSNPDDQIARMYLANLSLRKSNSEAINEYKRLLENNQNNFIALNNLAWALGQQGELTEAIELAEKANTLRPDTPQILDTLGYLYLQAGELTKASTMLKKAHDLAPDDPSVAYHYAMALKQSGDSSNAKKRLLAIVDKQFPESQKAKKLLQELN